MDRALSQKMEQEVPRRLADLLAVPPNRIEIKRQPVAGSAQRREVDMLVSTEDLNFAVEYKATSDAASVAMAARSVRKFAAGLEQKGIPIVAVPYMGEVGRRICGEAQVCWLDLSGNAHLVGPGLRIEIEGKPNLFKRPGRPRSLFAPKSARIARCLLIEPGRAFSQRELAKATGLDEGFTSRIVHQLEEQHLIVREENGAVKLADSGMMLDAWCEVYDFSKHHIVRGHIAARSGDEVLHRLSSQLKQERLEHAATGLAGAWLLSHFAGFRLVTVYVDQIPSAELQQRMGFREEQRGENVWLVVPNDEGVFHGAAEREGIRSVHPVQVYLDLKNHPERAAEAAEQLRGKLLKKESRA